MSLAATMRSSLPATTARQLRLVTFDITGTLLHFRHPPADQYAIIGARHGVYAKPSELAEGFKKQWKSQSAKHPNFGASTGLSWKLWWVELARGTFLSASSLAFDNKEEGNNSQKRDAKLTSVAHHLIEAYSTPECWRIVDGAPELLKRLQKDGLVLGVVSNFDMRLENLLSVMGLRDFFSFVIASYDLGVAKPDARIFQEALRRTREQIGSVDPKEACHIGDTPSSDYVGAVEAGWNAAIVHPTPKDISSVCDKVDPSHVVNNLRELEFYLLNERQKKSAA